MIGQETHSLLLVRNELGESEEFLLRRLVRMFSVRPVSQRATLRSGAKKSGWILRMNL
jgi:hypothetical protein